MNRTTASRLLFAMLLSTATCVQAQAGPSAGAMPAKSQQGQAGDTQRGRRPGPPMDELTRVLDLKGEQRDGLEALFRKRHEAMQAEREDREKQRAAQAVQFDAQVAKLLSPQQLAKFREWEKTHRPPPGEGRGGREGGEGRRPPPRDGDDDRGPPPRDAGDGQ